MKKIHIRVRNKIATCLKRDYSLVCGNDDYKIKFDFDEEWDEYPNKIARFIWNGEYMDVPFTGDICNVPAVFDATVCYIGVYVEDFETTTPARVEFLPSILCMASVKNPENDKRYADETKENAGKAKESATAAETAAITARTEADEAAASANTAKTEADRATAAANDAETNVRNALAQAKENGEFDGKDGKDGKDAELVQDLGNSEDKAVSQKVVTAHLTDHADRLSVLENKLDFSAFVTDDSNKYTKEVPANALPIAEVSKIGGMTRKCTNLIPYPYADTTKTENGITFTDNGDGTVTVNGTATANADFMLSNNLDVKKGMIISGVPTGGSGTTFEIQAFLDSNNYITTNAGFEVSTTDFSSPARIRIRSGFAANKLVFKPMLNEGSTALPYEPYFEGLRSTEVTKIENVGANLISYPYFETTKTRNGITFTDNGDGSITANGTATGQAYFTLRQGKPLPVGEYFLNGKSKDGNNNTQIYLSNGNYSLYRVDNGSGVYIDIQKEEPIDIVININKGTTVSNLVFKPMLVKGSTAKPYAPYIKHSYPIPEAARPDNGINDTVYDYIYYEDGWKNAQRVGCVDMGALNWVYNSGYFLAKTTENEIFMQAKTPSSASDTIPVICGSYESKPWYIVQGRAADKTVSVYGGIYGGSIVYDTAYTDVASFKSAMSGVLLCYELAEPVITDISDILTDNYIEVECGGTVTMVNEHQYDVPSEITYQVKKVMS